MEWIESDSGYDVCIESKRITVCNLTTRIINLDQIIAEKHNKVNILTWVQKTWINTKLALNWPIIRWIVFMVEKLKRMHCVITAEWMHLQGLQYFSVVLFLFYTEQLVIWNHVDLVNVVLYMKIILFETNLD